MPAAIADPYDFPLPPERIAQHPARPRDAARLLDLTGGGCVDRQVSDLPGLLASGDVLVVNDTRVIPAQLEALRGTARIGLTLDRPLGEGLWHALARNARRLRVGDTLTFPGSALAAEVVANEGGGSVVVRFTNEDALTKTARIALPPYIARPAGPSVADRDDYQTVYARQAGAVAAPTAGLHFTPALLAALAARGVGRQALTLHVGAGTFLPVREGDAERHRLHPERGEVTAAAAAAINTAVADTGGRLVAVGTTSLRLLESAADPAGRVQPYRGETDLFIKPGHRFRTARLLLTNFHLPRSTLFMLVCAFAGTERMRAAYAHAIAAGYRFYSYGDACLLERA